MVRDNETIPMSALPKREAFKCAEVPPANRTDLLWRTYAQQCLSLRNLEYQIHGVP